MQFPDGAFLVNKDAGISSHGVLDEIKYTLRKTYQVKSKQLPKLGHGGTLDPFATGLLVVLVGKATKLARHMLSSKKGYTGTIKWGETTLSGDSTQPVSDSNPLIPDQQKIEQTAAMLKNQVYLQTPPMFSAKKVNGKKLYELARKGQEVEREPVPCHLYELDFSEIKNNTSEFRVQCSAGTYIRTLAQDMGSLCGTVALLDTLHRTGSGKFDVSRSVKLEDLCSKIKEQTALDAIDGWLPFNQLLDHLPASTASEMEVSDLKMGRQRVLVDILSRSNLFQSNEKVTAIYQKHDLVAVAKKESNIWQIERVFV